jgi:hypothetical protein
VGNFGFDKKEGDYTEDYIERSFCGSPQDGIFIENILSNHCVFPYHQQIGIISLSFDIQDVSKNKMK